MTFKLYNLYPEEHTEVCSDVRDEPPLQPLTGETRLRFATANREDEARVDVSAAGFWGYKYQKAFFDVKVFNATECVCILWLAVVITL